MFYGRCRTTLGESEKGEKINWPRFFAFAPKQGDIVRSACGKYEASIIRITYLCVSQNEQTESFELLIGYIKNIEEIK